MYNRITVSEINCNIIFTLLLNNKKTQISCITTPNDGIAKQIMYNNCRKHRLPEISKNKLRI